MTDREPADDVAEDQLAGDGSGDPNDDRSFLQHQPPAQARPTHETQDDDAGGDSDVTDAAAEEGA